MAEDTEIVWGATGLAPLPFVRDWGVHYGLLGVLHAPSSVCTGFALRTAAGASGYMPKATSFRG